MKDLIRAGRVNVSKSAIRSGAALGFDYIRIVNAVFALTPEDFYKSMTTYGDHHVWQDVYRPATSAGEIYLKLMVIDDVLIVSFKEL